MGMKRFLENHEMEKIEYTCRTQMNEPTGKYYCMIEDLGMFFWKFVINEGTIFTYITIWEDDNGRKITIDEKFKALTKTMHLREWQYCIDCLGEDKVKELIGAMK